MLVQGPAHAELLGALTCEKKCQHDDIDVLKREN
jgi:hypothetical protein